MSDLNITRWLDAEGLWHHPSCFACRPDGCCCDLDCANCQPCHCGESVDTSDLRNRGMCTHCDDVRCDAYPGACGR